MSKTNSRGFGHIHIDYDLAKGYEAVRTSISYYGGGDFKEDEVVERTFSTGDVCSDFFAATTFLIFDDGVERISLSSDCDHFAMDIKGYSWYESTLFGELICTTEDQTNNWHSYVRQFGKNTGRTIWVQGSRGKKGEFAVIDNVDEVLLMLPDGTTKNIKTIDEAKEQADKGNVIMIQQVAKFEKVSVHEYIRAFGLQDVSEESVNSTETFFYAPIKLPKRATTGSAGNDFYSPINFSLAPGETIKIATGIRARIDEGWVLLILPRSGHGFKFRVQLDNTVGVIDSDYYYSDNEGHIILKLTNDGKTGETMCVKAGEAFAQGIFVPFGITTDDDVTAVRNGGLGSTSSKN